MDKEISIHAPSRERQRLGTGGVEDIIHFNPRSLAGATPWSGTRTISLAISIHAPSRERLALLFIEHLKCLYFNPRSLAGATAEGRDLKCLEAFQSTLPRGSDATQERPQHMPGISIHAPSRERHLQAYWLKIMTDISIHAPSRERLDG